MGTSVLSAAVPLKPLPPSFLTLSTGSNIHAPFSALMRRCFPLPSTCPTLLQSTITMFRSISSDHEFRDQAAASNWDAASPVYPPNLDTAPAPFKPYGLETIASNGNNNTNGVTCHRIAQHRLLLRKWHPLVAFIAGDMPASALARKIRPHTT